jgi:hypothetical protein
MNGKPPDPGMTIPSANLTPGGELAGWSEADFIEAMHTGLTPSGRQLDPEMMPYEEYHHTDEELAAMFAYLQSLPATETGY